MEFTVPINDLLKEQITKLTYITFTPGFQGLGINETRQARIMQENLAHWVDQLGKMSAEAQGLNRVITTVEKLRKAPDHSLYVMKYSKGNGGKGELVALLKVGRKHLFLFDEKDAVREFEPLCVLDFYVRGDLQRNGLGKKLFDYMLREEGVHPEHLAIDGPSPKMEQFLRKNYSIDRLVHQSNNFAVSPKFFSFGVSGSSGRNTPVPTPAVGRFTAHKPPSSIADVIHGGNSTGAYYHDSSRSSSRGTTTPEPEFSLERKKPEPIAEPTPERPTSLQVEALKEALLDVEQQHCRVVSPAGVYNSRRDLQLTERGHFDLKNYHSKLW